MVTTGWSICLSQGSMPRSMLNHHAQAQVSVTTVCLLGLQGVDGKGLSNQEDYLPCNSGKDTMGTVPLLV